MSSLRTKLWLGGQGLENSEQLEKLIGREEVSDSKGQTKVRYLMPSEDIRQMKPHEGLVCSPAGQFYKVTMHPYFRQIFFNLKTTYPPFVVSRPMLGRVPLTAIHAKTKAK